MNPDPNGLTSFDDKRIAVTSLVTQSNRNLIYDYILAIF